MSRIATGMSKKSNRINAAACSLALSWKAQFGIGTKMDAEFAYVVSNGKFGTKPQLQNGVRVADLVIGEPTINTIDVALYIIKAEGKVR